MNDTILIDRRRVLSQFVSVSIRRLLAWLDTVHRPDKMFAGGCNGKGLELGKCVHDTWLFGSHNQSRNVIAPFQYLAQVAGGIDATSLIIVGTASSHAGLIACTLIGH